MFPSVISRTFEFFFFIVLLSSICIPLIFLYAFKFLISGFSDFEGFLGVKH